MRRVTPDGGHKSGVRWFLENIRVPQSTVVICSSTLPAWGAEDKLRQGKGLGEEGLAAGSSSAGCNAGLQAVI